jgi:hypothetical protein
MDIGSMHSVFVDIVPDMVQTFDISHLLHWHLPLDLAQQFKEPDLAGDVGKMWNNFVKTGQAWAFLGGLILGYLVKSFTTFG